jgi:hypothetical protein
MAVLVGMRAPKDDHDALDVGVAAFGILIGAILRLLRATTLLVFLNMITKNGGVKSILGNGVRNACCIS